MFCAEFLIVFEIKKKMYSSTGIFNHIITIALMIIECFVFLKQSHTSIKTDKNFKNVSLK